MVQLSLVVEDLKRPVGVNLLVDVEDGRHHVGLHVVKVGVKVGAPGVLPQAVHCRSRQPELVADPALSQWPQRVEDGALSVLLKVKEPVPGQQ